MKEFEFHEAANIFPLDEETIPELAEDIRKNGLLETVKLCDGRVLDGRRRLKACELVGVAPRFENVSPPDPVAYSWSMNGPRRHLTPSQKSMAGARMRELYDRQAKERQKNHGGTAPGKRKTLMENLPQVIPDSGAARDHVGKVVGVSGKSIDYATQVLEKGVPELAQAVDEGRMAVSTAAALASEPADVQRQKATDPKRNRKYTPEQGNNFRNGKPEEKEDDGEIKARGVGVDRAHEAINCLKRIPKDDGLRKSGFRIVRDWIRHNE